MGKIGEEYVTTEVFVEGTFRKYINNNGSFCSKGYCSKLFEKAQCLAHFTYERSGKEVMVLDIQGCEYSLIDPEIASKEHPYRLPVLHRKFFSEYHIQLCYKS